MADVPPDHRSTEWVPVRLGRWERPGFGAIEERGRHLWAHLPTCGHDHYTGPRFDDALKRADQQLGLCYRCWAAAVPSRSEVAHKKVPQEVELATDGD